MNASLNVKRILLLVPKQNETENRKAAEEASAAAAKEKRYSAATTAVAVDVRMYTELFQLKNDLVFLLCDMAIACRVAAVAAAAAQKNKKKNEWRNIMDLQYVFCLRFSSILFFAHSVFAILLFRRSFNVDDLADFVFHFMRQQW